MERLGVKKSGVLAVLLIILFVTSTFTVLGLAAKPYQTVTIGVIVPVNEVVTPIQDLYTNVVGSDINAYVAKLPVSRFVLPLKFEFQVVGAGPAASGPGPADMLKQLKMFHKNGVDMIIGGWWSSQIDSSVLNYLTKNKMVMISPSSNAPSLALSDNLFRLMPDASVEGAIDSAMFTKLGLTRAIVLSRNDNFAAGVLSKFTIPIANTYTFNIGDVSSFITAVGRADTYVKGLSSTDQAHTGVLLIAAADDCATPTTGLNSETFLTDYQYISSLHWFGTDFTNFDSRLFGTNEDKLEILAPNPATPTTTKFNDMKARYDPILADWIGPMDYSGANNVDAAWILAMAVIETRSSTFFKSPVATDVIKVLSDDCSRYFGYSGWCQLNQFGDRVPNSGWEIWGFGYDTSTNSPGFILYGNYDLTSGTLNWIITP
jgi:ABC-type branched-subunit amino acid transport system substrate-binding protein